MHDTTFIGLHGVPTTDHLECGLCLVFDITGIRTTFSPYFTAGHWGSPTKNPHKNVFLAVQSWKHIFVRKLLGVKPCHEVQLVCD